MEIVVPAEYQSLYVTNEDRPVIKIPDPVLRQKAAKITKVTKRHRTIAENMIRIMKDANGVGLAGPQIGLLERIIVIRPSDKPLVLINPIIVESSGTDTAEEGCLSIPGLYGDVERSEKVQVEALDIKGRKVTYDMDDYAARIVQHEIDHLDGILFIDKVKEVTLHWQMPATSGSEE